VAFCCVAALARIAVSDERPEALERMVAYRSALATAEIDLRKTYYSGGGALDGEPRTIFKQIKSAGDRHIHVLRGDQYGIVIRSTSGGVSPVGGRSPEYRLECPGESWRRSEDSPVTSRFAHRNREYRDPRTLGAASAVASGDIHDVVWDDRVPAPAARRYEESTEGDLCAVRVRSTTFTRTYWLDPSRGWSPVRVREEYQDGNWSESRSTLELMDGVWFPRTVYFFSSNHREGQEPAIVFEVDRAEFNRPEHPATFIPADIGVDVGTMVFDYDIAARSSSGRWDGEKVVSHGDYRRRLVAGEIREGPMFLAQLQRSGRADSARGAPAAGAGAEGRVAGASPGTDRPVDSAGPSAPIAKGLLAEAKHNIESFWEAYVREFIGRYQLNAEQRQKSWGILRSCQEQGDAHVNKHKSELDRLDQRIKALPNLKGEERVKGEAQIKRDRQRLLKPLDDIFERQLKPRLDKLPTRAQRKAAEERKAPATRPAGKK